MLGAEITHHLRVDEMTQKDAKESRSGTGSVEIFHTGIWNSKRVIMASSVLQTLVGIDCWNTDLVTF